MIQPRKTAAFFPARSRNKFRGQDLAFTRLELLVALSCAAALAVVLAPAVGTHRGVVERSLCENNLRRIGTAMNEWMGARNQQPPWRTPLSDGGTFSFPKAGNAWFEMLAITNELASPKVLACPADSGAAPAPNWPSFASSAFRQRGISYSLSLDVASDATSGFFMGDLNMRYDAFPVSCSSGINTAAGINLRTGLITTGWTNAVHGEVGHVLLFDGRVELTGRDRLIQALLSGDDAGSFHMLSAR